MATLGELESGEKGRITALKKTDNIYRSKLLAMGLTPGTLFSVSRVAPLGDPIQLEIRGFQLTVRRDEAKTVEVSRL